MSSSDVAIGTAEGVFPSQALDRGDRGRVDRLRRLPDPARGDPAGQRRPAARRLRLGAALQLPARRRLDRRGEDRGPRLPEGRPPRRRRARARPPLSGAADRGAGAARRRARQGEPEELDRPPRRLHPGADRPPPPLRRDPRRLPRQALPGGRAALLRDPGPDRALAQPAAPGARRRPARRRGDPPPAGRVPAALPRLPRAARVGAGARRRPLPQRRPLRARATASSATGRRRTACRSTSRGSAPTAGPTTGTRSCPSAAGGSCSSRRSSTCCSRPRASASRPRSPPR